MHQELHETHTERVILIPGVFTALFGAAIWWAVFAWDTSNALRVLDDRMPFAPWQYMVAVVSFLVVVGLTLFVWNSTSAMIWPAVGFTVLGLGVYYAPSLHNMDLFGGISVIGAMLGVIAILEVTALNILRHIYWGIQRLRNPEPEPELYYDPTDIYQVRAVKLGEIAWLRRSMAIIVFFCATFPLGYALFKIVAMPGVLGIKDPMRPGLEYLWLAGTAGLFVGAVMLWSANDLAEWVIGVPLAIMTSYCIPTVAAASGGTSAPDFIPSVVAMVVIAMAIGMFIWVLTKMVKDPLVLPGVSGFQFEPAEHYQPNQGQFEQPTQASAQLA